MTKQVFVAHANRDFKLPNGFNAFIYRGSAEERDAITAGIIGNQYTQVAELEFDTDDHNTALELAFEKTNHIGEHWFDNPEVKKLLKADARSTSVGDVMTIDGKLFIVANFGFDEIDLVDYFKRTQTPAEN